jgi:tRNA 2-thiouridine synthesizing protein A
MLLHKEIKNIKEGQILSIVATDPSTTRDVPKFCHFLGHKLIAADEIDGKFHYYIKKGLV